MIKSPEKKLEGRIMYIMFKYSYIRLSKLFENFLSYDLTLNLD